METIKTNFLNREIDNQDKLGLEIPNMDKFVKNNLHPAFSSAIKNNSHLRKLIYGGIANGVVFRNAKTKEFRNYWTPLANAGLAAVPRPTHFHESTFMMHDILHHNYPDLLIDVKNDVSRKVYIIHRVIGEAVTLVLADAFAVDLAVASNKIEPDINPSHYIYPGFIKKFPNIATSRDELRQALEINSRFAVLGEVNPTPELQDYFESFKVIYEGDLKWTAHNFDNFKVNKQWADWVKSKNNSTVIALSDFMKDNSINETMNNEDIFSVVLGWYLDVLFNKQLKEKPYGEYAKNATDLFILFNAKGMLDYDYSFEELDNDLEVSSLDSFFDKASKLNPRAESCGGVFPLFDNMYISYNGANQEKLTLAEISNRVLNESRQLVAFKELINATGGKIIRSRIVSEIGVAMIAKTQSTTDENVMQILNLDSNYPEIDLNAKMTYLSSGSSLVDSVYNGLEHKSIANNTNVSFVIAGLSLNTLLELCSSSAMMNRLNTDITKVHVDGLYTVLSEKEIPWIEQFYKYVRPKYVEQFKIKHYLEQINRFNLKEQSMVCTISFSLDNWEWFLKKKSTYPEKELVAVCKKIYEILKKEYSFFPKISFN